MTIPRFSIRGLLILVFVSAAGLVALRFPSVLAASIAYSLMLSLLVVSVVGVLRAEEPRRGTWVGFAVASWAYAYMAFVAASRESEAPRKPEILTEHLLAAIDPYFESARWPDLPSLPAGATSPFEMELIPKDENPPTAPFMTFYTTTVAQMLDARASAGNPMMTRYYLRSRIGHCLFCPMAGIVGGWIAGFFRSSGMSATAATVA